MQLRVMKLGGSLLSQPRLRDRIDRWLASEPEALTLMVVGGGPPVDTIRDLATLFPYDQEFLHWLCIDLLDISYRLMSAQLTDWTQVRSPSSLESLIRDRSSEPAPIIKGLVSVSAFYDRETESQLPVQLPRSWDTTSDSLAALLSRITGADELVLFKSCSLASPGPRSRDDWEGLAQLGIVDNAFPAVIEGLPRVRCVNL